MVYNIRWRRAIMVSVFCHIFILAGAGYLSAQLLTVPVDQEQYVELELMNESQGKQELDPTSNPVSNPTTPASVSTLAPEKVTQAPSSLTPAATQSIVSTGELTSTSTNSNEITTGSAEPASAGSAPPRASTGSKSSSIVPPSILSRVAPPYPPAARQAGLEGTVILKIQIFENGRADNVSITRSSGSEALDDAAITTIKQWRFVPAKDSNGQAIPCYTTIPISFRLQQ